jgi:HlyD family secretion protein
MIKQFKFCTICIILFLTTMLSGCEKYDQNAVYGYIEGRFTYISSQMTGTLESIAVERGTPITKNQALATLEYNPEQA